MLAVVPASWLVVPYVMAAQALSGIAKDLTKMSSKSAVQLVVAEDAPGALYRWVAILTGSKNALKGVGFFLGALMLSQIGFRSALGVLLALVATGLVTVLAAMRGDLGRPDAKARFRHMFSNNRAVNVLAGARIFLFASRDVWFVVGLPVFFRTEHGWTFWQAGGFLAAWTIGYGIVQASAPRLIRRRSAHAASEPDGRTAAWLAFALAAFPLGIAAVLAARLDAVTVVVCGLLAVRRRLRAELRRALLPDPRLRRGRPGGDERRLLLHGQRGRASRRHRAVGRPVPVAGARGLPVGVRRVRAGGRRPLAAAAGRSGRSPRRAARLPRPAGDRMTARHVRPEALAELAAVAGGPTGAGRARRAGRHGPGQGVAGRFS